jgi:hypothetical protein
MPLAHAEMIAYLAGLFDGEGSISARHHFTSVNSVMMTISVTMCDRAPVERFAEVFGGHVRTERRLTRSGKPIYTCTYHARHAADILEAFLPYLTVKADRARDAIAVARMMKSKSGQRRPLSSEEIEERRVLVTRIRARNLGSNGRLASYAP